MNKVLSYSEFITEARKTKNSPDWHDSDAPDANGKFKNLGLGFCRMYFWSSVLLILALSIKIMFCISMCSFSATCFVELHETKMIINKKENESFFITLAALSKSKIVFLAGIFPFTIN